MIITKGLPCIEDGCENEGVCAACQRCREHHDNHEADIGDLKKMLVSAAVLNGSLKQATMTIMASVLAGEVELARDVIDTVSDVLETALNVAIGLKNNVLAIEDESERAGLLSIARKMGDDDMVKVIESLPIVGEAAPDPVVEDRPPAFSDFIDELEFDEGE